MANLSDLRQYLGYEFSSGAYAGKDYLTFQTKYINYLRSMCKQNGWELIPHRNHYEFSAFIKNTNGKCVYIAISDVRYWQDEWYDHILIRTAKDERDFRGGTNLHTRLVDLEITAQCLL